VTRCMDFQSFRPRVESPSTDFKSQIDLRD
jgi:hypothetical protein